eukprot:TRINITY_DN543_c0_g1_i1.p1 TRINITY_DN543_c0_g1~~TRINITY_DN543_c0_g1_i1.p1  ORF type:complete len:244 (-),score=41.31 TRINITY_DN543_c0_g1_i1:25-756(-)
MVDSITLGLAVAALSLLFVWTISFVIAHLVKPTTWDPIINAVSECGVLPHKTAKFIWVCWWTMAGISWLLCGCLGHTMWVLLNGNLSPRGIAGIAVLAVFGLSRILTSLFPTDVRDNAPDDVKARKAETEKESGDSNKKTYTRDGILHLIFAFFSFTCIVFASQLFSSEFESKEYSSTHLGKYQTLLSSIAWVEVITAVLMIVGRRFFKDKFGAIERLFYLAHVLWLYTCTVLLIITATEIGK